MLSGANKLIMVSVVAPFCRQVSMFETFSFVFEAKVKYDGWFCFLATFKPIIIDMAAAGTLRSGAPYNYQLNV